MKLIKFAFIAIVSVCILNACEKDEGKLPNISFKTGGNYLSKDDSLAVKSAIVIGISASKSEDKDVLKKFNISKSVNGGSSVSVLNQDLSSSEEDNFNFDFNTNVDSTVGQSTKYIFTVTNRDGLTNSLSLTVVGK